MTYRIAINGYGRIGRCIVRAFFERQLHPELSVVAINDSHDLETSAFLTQRDTVHGFFSKIVSTETPYLLIDDQKILMSCVRNPNHLRWGDLGIDVVLECTGRFTTPQQAEAHLHAGARKVLISAPAGPEIKTIVFGVNEHAVDSSDRIVSNGSCTTNSLAPIAQVLHSAFSIESGFMVTVHAYTNDQNITDRHHKDWRRARAAACSMIPTHTGAAKTLGLVLPELADRIDGYAIRVPTPNVSLLDLTVQVAHAASVQEVNAVLQNAATRPQSIMAYSTDPLVSIDYVHHPASCIVDALETRTTGQLIHVAAWYDNEWAFACRMLDTARVLCMT